MHENEYRFVFEKTGRLKFISHLDLLRTMQRVFARAEMPIEYSQGFNPHPQMTFALPLSVGMESVCEILDVRLTRPIDCEAEKEKINATMPECLKLHEIYLPERKASEVRFAEYVIALSYGSDSERANEILQTLFDSPVIVLKKTKSGEKETDIVPFIKRTKGALVEGRIKWKLICYAGNDAYLNPFYAITALSEKVGKEPEEVRIVRTRVFDEKGKEFR